MMLKIACSISLLCVVSLGLVGHGVIGNSTGLNQVSDGDQEPEVAVAIRLADDEKGQSVSDNFYALHDRVYGFWNGLANGLFHSKKESKDIADDFGDVHESGWETFGYGETDPTQEENQIVEYWVVDLVIDIHNDD